MVFKKIFAIIIAFVTVALSSCDTAADMGERTTMEFVKDMGMGINLGNTFDCSGDWFARTVETQETAWGSQADYDELNMWFDMMEEHFIDKGIAVIVGEYGCFGDNKTRETREQWMLDVGTAAHERQMCPILWDTPGGEFNRDKCEYEFQGFIEKLVDVGER